MSKTDSISRQSAIEVIEVLCQEHRYKIPGKRETYSQYNEAWQDALDRAEGAIFNLPSAQPERQINLDGAETSIEILSALRSQFNCFDGREEKAYHALSVAIHALSAQPERCEYYALCRHGRDENELRASLGFCEYCNEDADGYVKPIEKNSHAFVRFGMDGWELSLKANGWHGSAKIRYCPMCGRRLTDG